MPVPGVMGKKEAWMLDSLNEIFAPVIHRESRISSSEEDADMRAIKVFLAAGLILFIACYASAEQESEFEGKYQVGSTSCTVKPIKMAFEVRWARGTGFMVFFFERETEDGKYIFVSEGKDVLQDRFEFDDHQFISGRFVRSDGKVFKVKKIASENRMMPCRNPAPFKGK